jgi:hypothetical protein
MATTPPNQSAGQSQAQSFAQDQRVTNGLRWFNSVCAMISLAMISWVATQFMQTRDNQLRLGIIVENLSTRLAKVEDDNDKERTDYQRLLERQQMQHLAIQQIQSHLRLR